MRRLLALLLFAVPAQSRLAGWTRPYESAQADHLDLTFVVPVKGPQSEQAVVGVDTGTVKGGVTRACAEKTAKKLQPNLGLHCGITNATDFASVTKVLAKQLRKQAGNPVKEVYFGCVGNGDFYAVGKGIGGGHVVFKVRNSAVFGDVKRRIFTINGDAPGKQIQVEGIDYMTRNRPWFKRGMAPNKDSAVIKKGEVGAEGWTRPYLSADGRGLDLTYAKALPATDGQHTGTIGVDALAPDGKEFDAVGLAQRTSELLSQDAAVGRFCQISMRQGLGGPASLLTTAFNEFDTQSGAMVYWGCASSGAFYGIATDRQGRRVLKVRNKKVFGDRRRRVFRLSRSGEVGQRVTTEAAEYRTHKRPWYIMPKTHAGSSDSANGGWTQPYETVPGGPLALTYVAPLGQQEGELMGVVGVDTQTLDLTRFDAPGLATLVRRLLSGKAQKVCAVVNEGDFAFVTSVLDRALTETETDAGMPTGVYVACENTGTFYGVFSQPTGGDRERRRILKVRNAAAYGDKRLRIIAVVDGLPDSIVEVEAKEYVTKGRPWYLKMKSLRHELKVDKFGSKKEHDKITEVMHKKNKATEPEGDAVGWLEPYPTTNGDSLDLTYCAGIVGPKGKFLGVAAVDTATLQVNEFNAPGLAVAVRTAVQGQMAQLCAETGMSAGPGAFDEVVGVLENARKSFESPDFRACYIGCEESGDFYEVAVNKEGNAVVKVRNQSAFGDKKRRIFAFEARALGEQIAVEEKKYMTRQRPWYTMAALMVADGARPPPPGPESAAGTPLGTPPLGTPLLKPPCPPPPCGADMVAMDGCCAVLSPLRNDQSVVSDPVTIMSMKAVEVGLASNAAQPVRRKLRRGEAP